MPYFVIDWLNRFCFFAIAFGILLDPRPESSRATENSHLVWSLVVIQAAAYTALRCTLLWRSDRRFSQMVLHLFTDFFELFFWLMPVATLWLMMFDYENRFLHVGVCWSVAVVILFAIGFLLQYSSWLHRVIGAQKISEAERNRSQVPVDGSEGLG